MVRRYQAGQRRDILGDHCIVHIYTHTHTHTHTCAYINSMDPQECNKEGRINTQNIQIFTAKYYKYFTISV